MGGKFDPSKLKIDKVLIKNFKSYKGVFSFDLKENVNVIVGDNEAGKSTILEAINLALTGQIYGHYIKNEISQFLFNLDVSKDYCNSLKSDSPKEPPSILIELYLSDYPKLRGNNNTLGKNCSGIVFSIEFDENYKFAYQQLCKDGEIKNIPVEYYKIVWEGFSRAPLIYRSIPLKSSLINSSDVRYSNGSDVYLSRIIKDSLEDEQKIGLTQCYRRMVENFAGEDVVSEINKIISDRSKISSKSVKVSVEDAKINAWEKIFVTYLDQIPFNQIGKGEQCVVKTNLALTHKRAEVANVILLEEPENHLSHGNLNKLLREIKDKCSEKQILITTHSSFVANKLGLDDLLLLNNHKIVSFEKLSKETHCFFSKLPGYDTLRLLLSDKVILVEGDSDELVVQKIYKQRYNVLPIENGVDVISVGLSYKRFLEIAKRINKKVAVIRDNDGNINSIESNDKCYLDENNELQKVFYDKQEHHYSGSIEGYNNNTLEPCLFRANTLSVLNKIFGKKYETDDGMLGYMKRNKTECALKVFNTDVEFASPDYITRAIEFISNGK